jgi:hypothetical protein
VCITRSPQTHWGWSALIGHGATNGSGLGLQGNQRDQSGDQPTHTVCVEQCSRRTTERLPPACIDKGLAGE